jgi:hypothetical protein
MPMPSESDADAKGYQVIMPITQQRSVLLDSRCERRVWKLFQDKSAVWRTVIYYNLCCSVITPMPTKHRLICAKTATRHFSKALVYDSGNRQRATRARAMCMRDADRAG